MVQVVQYESKIDNDYNTFNKYPDKIIDYPENSSINQEDEFNNDREIYYSKALNL